MSIILQISDFQSGRFKIAFNTYQENSLDDYITKYEKKYLPELFGFDLYALFLADLVAGVPASPIYQAVFNEFNNQNDCGICQSEGMKEMMKAFVYFHYERDANVRSTTQGVKQSKGENSVSLDQEASNLATRFNEGVNSYRCIQDYMCENSTDYPDFKGVELDFVLFI